MHVVETATNLVAKYIDKAITLLDQICMEWLGFILQ